MKTDVFGARSSLDTGFGRAVLYRLDALEKAGVAPGLARLPFSIKVLLEAVLRNVDGELVTEDDVQEPRGLERRGARSDVELPFMPARVILQDFTGVPVRRRPRRDARRGEAPRRRPEADQPARAGRPRHRPLGAGRRLRHDGRARAATPRSSSSATASATSSCAGARRRSQNFRVVPPATGIVHQVNLEYLAKGVLHEQRGRRDASRSPTRSSAPTRTPR